MLYPAVFPTGAFTTESLHAREGFSKVDLYLCKMLLQCKQPFVEKD